MANGRQAILTAGIDFSRELGLELGPLNRPVIKRSNGRVIYVDYADTDSLKRRYADDVNVPVDDIVDVDATWGGNTLQQAIGSGVKVDYIVASHVIEHVPDLIAWLDELVEVLKIDGKIRLAIPDRRYSFDYLRGETRLADVICAHMAMARVPQPHEVLDFTLNKTQIDPVTAWREGVDESVLGRDFTFDGCMHLANDVVMNATYHDVHCWVFTPASFARLLREMATHGLTDLGCDSFTDTSYGEFEFFVRAQPMENKDQRIASWSLMETEALNGLQTRSSINERGLQVAKLNEQVAAMTVQVDQMAMKIAYLTSCVEAYEGSRSWKVTAPLRAIVRSLHKRSGQRA